MADKTPVRVVFNASNVATGLAEFQSGDTVGTAFGGTGLTSIGSAGQVLKANAAGDALEFAAEGDVSITNLVAPTNADLTFTTSGTGNIVLDAITVRGTTLSSADSSSININEGLIVDGTLNVSGQATLSGLAFPTSDGSANQFLKTDGSGTLSFADVSLGDFSFIGSTISNSSNADLTLDPSGTGSIKLNAATDVTGAVTITTTTTDASLLITTTEDSNSAAPVIELKRNSSSPADADYLGRLTFKGENDADQAVTYARISGKILDASDGSEDGAIEFNTIKAGSGTISARLNSDELKLLNGTALDVDGSGTFAGSVTATSLTTNTISSNGSNADLSIQPSGTGDVLIGAIRINGTTLDSSDSSIININENTIVDGTLTVSGALASSTSLALASGATVTGIADEDDMSSDSNTLLATQQSIKAYVDAQITAEDLDFQADSGGALSIDLDSETMTFTGGTGIDTSGSGNAVTFAIDSTVATLTGSQTLTNKVLTSPTISTPTVTGAMTATSVTTNDITTNGSNADLDVSPQGTGKVQFYGAYTFPTSDGSNGTALVTDGSGALSFGTVGDPSASDLTDSVVRKDKRLYINRARAIDKFDVTFCDSVLYYVCTNDYKNDIVNIQKLSVVHNNSTAFISGSGINNSDDIDMPVFTADVSGDLVVVKGEMTSDDSSIDAIGGSTTFLKLPLGDNSSAGTSGNTQLIVNSDVDSASEAFDTFAHGTYRGAKYFFSVNNDTKTELENIEVLVVHDGSDAYMTQYAGVRTGNDPLMTVTAAISGSNVVVSVAGLEPNLRVTANIIRLKDTMVSDSGSFANTEAIAPTTISSTATAIVDLDTVSKGNGAVIYVVGKNATEGAFSISEVFMAVSGSGDISVSSPGQVSTKSSEQLEFSTGFKDDEEATAQLFASSTSGGSTTCSAYRINLLAN